MLGADEVLPAITFILGAPRHSSLWSAVAYCYLDRGVCDIVAQTVVVVKLTRIQWIVRIAPKGVLSIIYTCYVQFVRFMIQICSSVPAP